MLLCPVDTVQEFHHETGDSFYADDEKIMGMTEAVNSSGSCTLKRGERVSCKGFFLTKEISISAVKV